MKLPSSGNTKCRPFYVKINCPKFRIDRLQQLCHVIFLIYLFVTSRNCYCLPRDLFDLFVCSNEKLLLFGLFLRRKIMKIFWKIVLNFRQMSLKGVLLSVSVLECFGKIFYKYLWKSWIFKNPLLHINFFTNDF